ncbi:MAG: SRPBCC family protein [Candidatus Cyclonatronum sp.]|uniref:SRPBCC family protein n=1 Tax=Cyclonatronum sp. TaxID=3024185 RepID=UPI0025BA55A9|nr:SRPBCC family protein [Cyclonatronum sp.]MCC5935487.1 SRPBCC family protein [Balneolales bacterium]MCH8488143.1 SRPBCC family protein [Cyclonatronum sp.]
MAHQRIEVNLPLAKVYESLNSPVDFPLFLSGIEQVIKINSQTYEYRTTIGGEEYKWTTNIIDDLRNTRFAWITINGNLNQTGTIRFTPLDNGTRTRVDFSLDYRPFFGEAEGELKAFIGGLDEQLSKDLESFRVALENGTFKEKNEETADKEQAAV